MATHTVGGMINGAFALIRINDETSAAEWSTNGSTWTPIAAGGSGDMEKSVYDTNDDGVVNSADYAGTAGSAETASHATTAGSAETANSIGTASSTDVENAVSNSHAHSNKTTLDKFGELSGAATFDGEPISGLPTASDDTPFLVWDVTNRGNDLNTKFLLQPIDSTGGIADTARGATTPAVITNSGSVSVNASGELVFDGTNYLEIPANALPDDIFVADHEWMFDIEFSCDDSTTIRYVFGRTGSNRIDLLIENGYLSAGGIINKFAPFSGGNALVTYEYFYDDTQANWVFAVYVNGNLKFTKLGQLSDYRAYPFRIGWAIDPNGRPGLDGTISMVRICNNAPYRGKSFTPTPRPYLEPLTGWAAKTVSQMRGILGLPDFNFVQQNISTPGEIVISTENGFCQFCEITSTNVSDGNLTFTLPELSIEHPEMEIALKISTSCTLSAKKSDGTSTYVFHTENEATTENVLHYIMHVKYVNGNTLFTFEKLWAI